MNSPDVVSHCVFLVVPALRKFPATDSVVTSLAPPRFGLLLVFLLHELKAWFFVGDVDSAIGSSQDAQVPVALVPLVHHTRLPR